LVYAVHIGTAPVYALLSFRRAGVVVNGTERVNIGLENYVVTISRQFGCPGRIIAGKMARLLDVEFYDRDILEYVAAEMNLPVPKLESDEVEAEYVKLLFPMGRKRKKKGKRSLPPSRRSFSSSLRKIPAFFWTGELTTSCVTMRIFLPSIIYAPRRRPLSKSP